MSDTVPITIYYINFFNSPENKSAIQTKLLTSNCAGPLQELRNKVLTYLLNGQEKSAAQSLANNFHRTDIGFLAPDASNFWSLFPAPPGHQELEKCDHIVGMYCDYDYGKMLVSESDDTEPDEQFRYCPSCGVQLVFS